MSVPVANRIPNFLNPIQSPALLTDGFMNMAAFKIACRRILWRVSAKNYDRVLISCHIGLIRSRKEVKPGAQRPVRGGGKKEKKYFPFLDYFVILATTSIVGHFTVLTPGFPRSYQSNMAALTLDRNVYHSLATEYVYYACYRQERSWLKTVSTVDYMHVTQFYVSVWCNTFFLTW